MVGADTTGGVVIGGVACGGGTDPDCIAVIAPSDSECAPAAAGCPVTIPVANDCPIDVGDTPCPRAAGDSDPPGIVTDIFGFEDLRQRLFRRKNVVDFLISFPCNAGQPAPQIVDGVSGGIEGALLYFVLLCLSDLGFRSPKVPANQVFGRSTLIPQQKIMLADQIPCELLLLHGPSGPVLRGGT